MLKLLARVSTRLEKRFGAKMAEKRLSGRIDYQELVDRYPNSILVFTDGASKNNPGVGGCGAVIITRPHLVVQTDTNTTKVPNVWYARQALGRVTNNMAELRGLGLALDTIRTADVWQNVRWHRTNSIVVFCDSKYVVTTIQNGKAPIANIEMVEELREKLLSVVQGQGIKVHLYWIRAHCGIVGNEEADTLCNRATKEQSTLGEVIVECVS